MKDNDLRNHDQFRKTIYTMKPYYVYYFTKIFRNNASIRV